MTVKAIPAGYHTLNSYLAVKGARTLIEFLKHAFGAEVIRISELDGTVMNAELKIGDSMLMVSDARGECEPRPAMIYMYVENPDALYEQAVKAGAKSIMPPTDMFYGDRHGGVEDPSGNQWWIAARIEDVSSEEVVKRAMQYGKK